MTRDVLVYAEQREGRFHPVVYELLGKGRELAEKLGGELQAVLLGHGIEELASELVYRGADRVFVYDHPSLETFDVVRYKENLVDLVRESRPEVFLFGATPIGKSLAPRVAAALGTGLTADCVDLFVDESGAVVQVRPAFTGNVIAYIRTLSRPVMATVRYRVMRPAPRDTSRVGVVERRRVVEVGDTGLRVLGLVRRREVDLSEAEVIVAGGRGLKRREDLKMLVELAKLLGGVVAVSRPLADEGWAPRDRQVGFSGCVVRPKLYIACGISGSPQHLAGMRDSEVIVAINIDPSAPIFRVAHYGIVGDLYEVVPQLIREIRCRKSSAGADGGGSARA